MSHSTAPTRAVVLLSGGLDSATVLAIALDQGFDCYALSMDYGQRHLSELDAAKRVAQTLGVKRHQLMPISLDAFGGSALTDHNIQLPEAGGEGIPVTYVPARNTIFLSLLRKSQILVIDVESIFSGLRFSFTGITHIYIVPPIIIYIYNTKGIY